MIKIKEIREEQGLTAPQLAKRMNLDLKTIWRWENGKNAITSDKLILIADALSCSVDELLGRENYAIRVEYKSELEKRKELRPSTLKLVQASEPLNDMGIAVVIGYIARLIEENPEFLKIPRQ